MFRETPTWRTNAVVELCRQMRESKDYAAMPVLADLLEEAGYVDEKELSFLRSPKKKWGDNLLRCQRSLALFSSDETAESVRWVESFASDIEQTYVRLMDAAETWRNYSDYTYDNSERYKDHWDKFAEFWKHHEVITGEVTEEKNSFFTCSC